MKDDLQSLLTVAVSSTKMEKPLRCAQEAN